MTYSMYLLFAAATLGRRDSDEPPADEAGDIDEKLNPAMLDLLQLCRDFCGKPVSPEAAFEFEQALQAKTRELNRCAMEWTFNRVEPPAKDLPKHVEFEGGLSTRLNGKTPQTIATTFGNIRLWRVGYRPTDKTGGPTIFPLAQQLGLVAGATAALAERAAYYQAEAGATQRRTLQRLQQVHNLNWSAKKLRTVTGHVAQAMAAERHEIQVEKLLHWLEQAWSSKGKHKPVLSVGRDGISFGIPVKGGSVFEVASAATLSVLDRRGQRLSTAYLAYTPESKQGTMSQHLTRLVEDVLRRWDKSLPRLCYVTDAGDNETTYYNRVLRPMRHPRTHQQLKWIRVVDYYHASERIGTMAEALFGKDPAAKSWTRRMLKLLKQRNGIRRLLNSAAALRGRYPLKGKRKEAFCEAYNYLRKRTKYMQYATYKRVGIPCGSGVTEAACKTIYTQRLKLSGMRWKKAGAQTILNLRVMLLSGVWEQAYRRILQNLENVKVPPYDLPNRKTLKNAA
jgi:hypothetical protein